MAWTIVFHPEVLSKDVPAIDGPVRKQLLKAIERKLPVDPEGYGEPLRKELFGYWKLKVGGFRVLYKIEKEKVMVLVVKIGPRKDSQVYVEMLKRAKKLLIP